MLIAGEPTCSSGGGNYIQPRASPSSPVSATWAINHFGIINILCEVLVTNRVDVWLPLSMSCLIAMLSWNEWLS